MDRYETVRKLGQGTYGSVYLCVVRETGKPCVMKRMLLRSLNEKERQSARQEAEVLQELSHPNIVAYIDTVETRSKLFLFMQVALASLRATRAGLRARRDHARAPRSSATAATSKSGCNSSPPRMRRFPTRRRALVPAAPPAGAPRRRRDARAPFGRCSTGSCR